jgi:hypothetical protein
VQRFVSGTASRDDCHLAEDRRVSAVHDPILVIDLQFRMCGGYAAQRIGDNVDWRIDELFHVLLLDAVVKAM